MCAAYSRGDLCVLSALMLRFNKHLQKIPTMLVAACVTKLAYTYDHPKVTTTE